MYLRWTTYDMDGFYLSQKYFFFFWCEIFFTWPLEDLSRQNLLATRIVYMGF